MRVISGYLKGRELLGYNVETTRPTMSRVKESMFASIQNYIDNSIVLDLFCGTGSLGIEALSMGASRCYFVDNNKDILRYLNKNINNLGINSKSIIVSKDYRDSLLYFKNKAGVVLFTRSSVHCAESMTAIANSKGVSKFKLHFASGYVFFNNFIIFTTSSVDIKTPFCIVT